MEIHHLPLTVCSSIGQECHVVIDMFPQFQRVLMLQVADIQEPLVSRTLLMQVVDRVTQLSHALMLYSLRV